jgi:hypothetical protein
MSTQLTGACVASFAPLSHRPACRAQATRHYCNIWHRSEPAPPPRALPFSQHHGAGAEEAVRAAGGQQEGARGQVGRAGRFLGQQRAAPNPAAAGPSAAACAGQLCCCCCRQAARALLAARVPTRSPACVNARFAGARSRPRRCSAGELPRGCEHRASPRCRASRQLAPRRQSPRQTLLDLCSPRTPPRRPPPSSRPPARPPAACAHPCCRRAAPGARRTRSTRTRRRSSGGRSRTCSRRGARATPSRRPTCGGSRSR